MAFEFETTKNRSELMKKIKSHGTKPELTVGKILWRKGYRYRKHYKKIPGRPDFVFVKQKVAVFIDGEFWHGFNWSQKKESIKSNRDYWIPKIERNMARDKKVNAVLRRGGWSVLRFWGYEIEEDIDKCLKQIKERVSKRRKI